jgi:hypothetical protein
VAEWIRKEELNRKLREEKQKAAAESLTKVSDRIPFLAAFLLTFCFRFRSPANASRWSGWLAASGSCCWCAT